jgi:plasmid stabilization system protein ParE
MNVVYSPRSIQDLERLATYYRTVASHAVAEQVGERIEDAIRRLVDHPHMAPHVDGRNDVRGQFPNFRTACMVRQLRFCTSGIRHGPVGLGR